MSTLLEVRRMLNWYSPEDFSMIKPFYIKM